MKPTTMKTSRCATRKSTEHNLDLAFNSLDAQRGLSSASNKGTVRFSVLAQRSSASTIRTKNGPFPVDEGAATARPRAR